MQIKPDFKKRVIYHITHVGIILILLLSIPFESCFENISLPFNKSSAVGPSTKHVDKLPTLGGEEFKDNVEKETFGGNIIEDSLPSIDHRSTVLENIPPISAVTKPDTISSKSDSNRERKESSRLLTTGDIQSHQSLAREQHEKKIQKQLGARTFRTREGGYTISFYKGRETWRAKVTNYTGKEMDLLAFLGEEDISRLVSVIPATTSSLQVVLPTSSSSLENKKTRKRDKKEKKNPTKKKAKVSVSSSSSKEKKERKKREKPNQLDKNAKKPIRERKPTKRFNLDDTDKDTEEIIKSLYADKSLSNKELEEKREKKRKAYEELGEGLPPSKHGGGSGIFVSHDAEAVRKYKSMSVKEFLDKKHYEAIFDDSKKYRSKKKKYSKESSKLTAFKRKSLKDCVRIEIVEDDKRMVALVPGSDIGGILINSEKKEKLIPMIY